MSFSLSTSDERSIKIQKFRNFIWEQLELWVSPKKPTDAEQDSGEEDFQIFDEETALEKLNTLKLHVEEKRRELDISDFEFHSTFYGPREELKFQPIDVISERDAQAACLDDLCDNGLKNIEFDGLNVCPNQIKSIVTKILFQLLKSVFFENKNINKVVSEMDLLNSSLHNRF